jgi:hypothetical protein
MYWLAVPFKSAECSFPFAGTIHKDKDKGSKPEQHPQAEEDQRSGPVHDAEDFVQCKVGDGQRSGDRKKIVPDKPERDQSKKKVENNGDQGYDECDEQEIRITKRQSSYQDDAENSDPEQRVQKTVDLFIKKIHFNYSSW